MPIYVYQCNECLELHKQKVESGQTDNTEEVYQSSVLFETSHKMNPTEEELSRALICPRCSSINASRTVFGTSFITYVRGYGWLDKNGVARDRNKFTIEHNDPYPQYRQDGEVNQIKENLQKKGKLDKKPQYFLSKVSTQDVSKAVNSKNDA